MRTHAIDPQTEQDRIETYRALRELEKSLREGTSRDEDLNKARRAEADLFAKAATLLERRLPERAEIERDQAVKQRDEELRERLEVMIDNLREAAVRRRDEASTAETVRGGGERIGEALGFDGAADRLDSIFEEGEDD